MMSESTKGFEMINVEKKADRIKNIENIDLRRWTDRENHPDHIHEFFEIVYIFGGRATHYIDNVEYRVKRGDILFINKNQTHRYDVAEGGVDMINILVNPEFISDELVSTESIMCLFKYGIMSEAEAIDEHNRQCVHFDGKDLEEVEMLISIALREFKTRGIGYYSAICNCIKTLFLKILRGIDCSDPGSPEKDIIDDILNYVEENLSEKLSLTELAAKSFYTPAYFGNLIKKHCKKSFNTYLKERRMARAAELLLSTEMSVNKIAETLGYRENAVFYRHFKDIHGITPNKYKKIYKKQ